MKIKNWIFATVISFTAPLFSNSFTDFPEPPKIKNESVGSLQYKDSFVYQKVSSLLFFPTWGIGFRQREGRFGYDLNLTVAPYVIYNLTQGRMSGLLYFDKLSKTSSPYFGLGVGGFLGHQLDKNRYNYGVTGSVLIGLENERGFWEIDFGYAHPFDRQTKKIWHKADNIPYITVTKGWKF